jgi:hypothetical protein
MLKTLGGCSLLLAIAVLGQQPPNIVEITAEPSHHQTLDNETIRVFNVVAPPKASTLIHKHNYDYLFVTLGDTDITNQRVGEQPTQLSLKDGEVRFTKGGFAHAVVNNSEHPFHNITIELLHPSSGVQRCETACEIPIPCTSADKTQCASLRKVVESDQWTVTSLTMPPGSVYPDHQYDGLHLVIQVSDARIKQQRQGGPGYEAQRSVGDLGWSGPLVETLTNTGNQTAKIVTLEFKPRR